MSQQVTTRTLDALRREAKRLLRDYRERQPSAVSRVSVCWPKAASPDFPLKLAQVQLVVARERGYRSWRHLRASVSTNTEGRQVMNVKAVVDQMAKLGAPRATVHVLTNEQSQADAVEAEVAARWGAGVVVNFTLTGTSGLPDAQLAADGIFSGARVVVGKWVEFCFAYARLGEPFLGPDAEQRFARQDQLLAGVTALIADVPEEERKVPCVISGKEGILASVKFSEFTSKYKQAVEMTA